MNSRQCWKNQVWTSSEVGFSQRTEKRSTKCSHAPYENEYSKTKNQLISELVGLNLNGQVRLD